MGKLYLGTDITALAAANSATGSTLLGFNTVQGPQQNTPTVVCAALAAKQDSDGIHFNLGGVRNATGETAMPVVRPRTRSTPR